MADRQTDPYAEYLERQRKLEAWKASRKAEKEQQDRRQKQAALESHLQRRRQEWRDYTGSEPPLDELRRWQQEFVDSAAITAGAELEARRAEAAGQDHYHPES